MLFYVTLDDIMNDTFTNIHAPFHTSTSIDCILERLARKAHIPYFTMHVLTSAKFLALGNS